MAAVDKASSKNQSEGSKQGQQAKTASCVVWTWQRIAKALTKMLNIWVGFILPNFTCSAHVVTQATPFILSTACTYAHTCIHVYSQYSVELSHNSFVRAGRHGEVRSDGSCLKTLLITQSRSPLTDWGARGDKSRACTWPVGTSTLTQIVFANP